MLVNQLLTVWLPVFYFHNIVAITTIFSVGELKKRERWLLRRQFLIFISYGEQMAGLHQCRRLSGMTAMRFPLRCHWSPHVPGVWWLGHGTSSWKNGSLFASLSHFVMVLANNLIFQVYVCTHWGSNSMDSLLSCSDSLCVWIWKHLKSFVMRGSRSKEQNYPL